MSAVYETVGYSVGQGTATITLNRPEGLNSWNEQLGAELTAALGAAREDAEVRAVVVTGAGRAFCSGADLRGGISAGPDGQPDLAERIETVYNPVIIGVRELPKPVIAAVNGPAVGIGCSLALACDLVVAAQSAYFLLAFANIGLSIDGGVSAFLAGRVGYGRTAEFALLADRVSAAEALGWNMINRVVPDGELEEAAGALAARLAGGPPGAYASIKTLLNESCYPTLATALEHEAAHQGERGRSADFAEGVAAFTEKRAPRFTGN